MFDSFDMQIQCEEYYREWKFLEWCEAMEEVYGKEENRQENV